MSTQIKSFDVGRIIAATGSRLLAAVCLVYFVPLMLAVAFVIKMESAGPVFQRQTRRGANGEVIVLWEFRTETAVCADPSDSLRREGVRTSVGAFLCEARLALLPRLINMLRGEVSLRQLFL